MLYLHLKTLSTVNLCLTYIRPFILRDEDLVSLFLVLKVVRCVTLHFLISIIQWELVCCVVLYLLRVPYEVFNEL